LHLLFGRHILLVSLPSIGRSWLLKIHSPCRQGKRVPGPRRGAVKIFNQIKYITAWRWRAP
jgi:hypothetical protein